MIEYVGVMKSFVLHVVHMLYERICRADEVICIACSTHAMIDTFSRTHIHTCSHTNA